MKRKLQVLVVLVMMLFALTGCGATVNVKINTDKTSEMTAKLAFTQTELSNFAKNANLSAFELMAIQMQLKQETIDGVTYYTFSQTEKMSAKDTKDYFARYDSVAAVIANQQNASTDISKEVDAETLNLLKQYGLDKLTINDFAFLDLTVTFPQPVVKATGTISADKKTVTWDGKKCDKEVQYAIFNEAKAKSSKITFAGLKNKKTYKAKKNNVLTIKGDGLITSVKVKKGSKTYKFPQKSFNKGNGYNKLNFTEKGKYTVTVKNYAGKSKTIKFTVK